MGEEAFIQNAGCRDGWMDGWRRCGGFATQNGLAPAAVVLTGARWVQI